jgi:hypothetical protein
MSDLPHTIDRLTNRLEELERRVDALEHPLTAHRPQPSHQAAVISTPNPNSALTQTGGMFGVVGTAMLGIAGAYLLRAVEETNVLPRLVVASAGIAYAFLWLAWAARGRLSRLSSTIYACTSVLILGPMLWELTLRFQVLPPTIAAGVLCAFSLAAFALARRFKVTPVLRVGLISVAGLSLALAIASHAELPFITVLLILAALCEFAPGREGMFEIRVPVALAADAAIWTLIFVYFSPQSARADYPQLSRAALVAPSIALFLIFAASVTLQTMVRGKRIAVFETIQTTITFLLAAVSLVDFGPEGIKVILGILCLILSAAGYTAVFTIFAAATEPRNRVVFAAWSAALLLAGCFLSLPTLPTIALLGAAAIAATALGGRRSWLDFQFVGIVFLLSAAAESGLLTFIGSALGGVPSGAPSLNASLIAGCAIVCYAAAKSHSNEPWKALIFHLAIAALAAGAAAAVVVQGLLALTALTVIPGVHHIAFIRTLVLCSAALALVFGGARWRQLELTRIGYATLALVAVKLLAEDMRHGHLAYIAGSIFLFAMTLIAAPRMAHARRRV